MNKLSLILASTALAAIMTVGASNADARSSWSVGINTGPGYYGAPAYYGPSYYGPSYYSRPVYRPNYCAPTYYGGYYGRGYATPYYAPAPSFSFGYSHR